MINVSQAFHRTSANPIDESLTLTKAQMLTVNDNLMPSKYLTVCQDDGKIYLYDKTNESDVETGRFRVFEGGSTVTVDPTPTQGSTNAVSSGGTYTSLSGKVDKVSGKQLSTEDYTTADKTKLAGINLSNYVPTSQKGANNGIAELDSSGKVPSSQLPSYVDDVVSRATKNDFPAEGEDDKIYIAKDENASYRWDGTDYVSISSANGLTLGETSSTAYRGDRGKTAYDDSQTNKTNIGTMSSLTTTEKSSLVDAINEVDGDLANKVDKVPGKGLSTNDYDNTEKQKVTNAQPQTLATAKTIEGASVTTVQGLADTTQTHTDRAVTDTNGVHGFKVTTSNNETKLYYKSGNSWEEIEISSSTQVSTLPTASHDNVGSVLQYIGSTTSVSPIYVHGFFYECVEDSGSYSWENVPVMDVQEIQKTALPTASADELGNIYQYVGSTTQTYRKGYWYECEAQGTEPETYAWAVTSVQPSSGGQIIQYDTMPTASSTNVGQIIQYTGATTQDYTNGYFYKCVAQGTDPETYAWEAQPVQEGGGGGDSRISEEVTKFGIRIENGEIIPYIDFDIVKIIPAFSDVTPEILAIILDAYYDGSITLADIQNAWSVGDYMTFTMPAIAATDGFEAHAQQSISFEIVDFDHDVLTTAEGEITKALLTLHMKDCFNETGRVDLRGNTGRLNYYDSARKTWLNTTFYDSLPSNVKPLVRPVDKQFTIWGDETKTDSLKAFLPSYNELGATIEYPQYIENKAGTLYSYYSSNARRVKKVNGTDAEYWMGSYWSGYNERTVYPAYITTTGNASWAEIATSKGLAVAMCM